MVRGNQAPANTQGERITQGQEYPEAAITGTVSESARHSWFALNKLHFHLSRCLYLPVALRDAGHNRLDPSDAWGSALLDAVTQVVLMEDSEKGNYSKGILGTGDTIMHETDMVFASWRETGRSGEMHTAKARMRTHQWPCKSSIHAVVRRGRRGE